MENKSGIFDYFESKQKNDTEYKIEYDVENSIYEMCIILKDYRKSKKISQQELANKTGLTRQMVSKVETYTSTPTLTTLIKYLKGLEIDFNELLKFQIINTRILTISDRD
jgi:transcriptional regulator with XRE-family HTH domain